MATVTPRGFTGQEHLDTTGLVHMNGRVYDAKIGRFLSADPHLQDETNLQAYNRYSYVLNNPLSYTDPSGFFFKKLFNAFKSVFKAVTSVTTFVLKNALREVGKLSAKVPGLSIAIQATACIYGGPAGCAVAAAALTYAAGGSLKDAAIAAAFAYGAANVWQTVGAGLGELSAAQGFSVFEEAIVKGAVHGTVGGALSAAQGGSFQSGFIANAAAGLSTPLIFGTIGTGLGIEDIAARTAAASAVGGAAAALSGGNFENGAMTAAFAWVFNAEQSNLIGHNGGPPLEGKPSLLGRIIRGFTKIGGLLAAPIGLAADATPLNVGEEAWLSAQKLKIENRANHVFRENLGKHKLEGLLQVFSGDSIAAYNAIRSAAQSAAVNGQLTSFGKTDGVFQSVVNVNNFDVTVRGRMVDGQVDVTTAFIP